MTKKHPLSISAPLLLIIITFFVLNIQGMSLVLGLAGILYSLSLFFVINKAGKSSTQFFPTQLPLLFFCLGLMVFHFSWGATITNEWITHGISEENVAFALALVAMVILMAAFGTRLGSSSNKDWKINSVNLDQHTIFSLAIFFVISGGAAQLWALRHNLVEFTVGAYGIDFSTHSGTFDTIILAMRVFLEVGEILLLVLILEEARMTNHLGVFLWKRFAWVFILIIVFIFDFIFRFQSAARATLLMTFLPILVTLYIYGYRKFVAISIIAGVVLYSTLVYPLVNIMRADTIYNEQLSRGELFIPDIPYLTSAFSNLKDNIINSLSRLNQTSLLAFSIQRQSDGLLKLDGDSYWYAAGTILPRFIIPFRVDEIIPYDYYTGYYYGSRSYNNWGIHTEAYLNFGVIGVVIITLLIGFLWQKVYVWLLHYKNPTGWAIVASLLLPSIFRAGEYNFQVTIISTLRSMVFIILIAEAFLIVKDLVNIR